jgi:hypothetical protein
VQKAEEEEISGNKLPAAYVSTAAATATAICVFAGSFTNSMDG